MAVETIEDRILELLSSEEFGLGSRSLRYLSGFHGQAIASALTRLLRQGRVEMLAPADGEPVRYRVTADHAAATAEGGGTTE